MRRIVAVAWHSSFSVAAAGLYGVAVVPRWPELTGQISPTLGTVLRLGTAALIGLAALPVVFSPARTDTPTPAALPPSGTLRTASIVLHVAAAVLIAATAVTEIWMGTATAGPALFGVYGAAAALAVLGVGAFYLSLVAQSPARSAPPQPPAADDAPEDAEDAEDAGAPAATAAEPRADPQPAGRLGNRRPSGKSALVRRNRRTEGAVTVED